jgi:hypothetical protein
MRENVNGKENIGKGNEKRDEKINMKRTPYASNDLLDQNTLHRYHNVAFLLSVNFMNCYFCFVDLWCVLHATST